MIKLMEVNQTPDLKKIIVAFADAKTDVGTGKSDTTIEGVDFDYDAGSLIYTADFKYALLDSDGNWNWKE